MRSLLFLVALICPPLAAHVGVSDVFFEGLAGPYPLYVTIRPPAVIPGVAEISIRSAAKDVTGIRITPMTLTGPGSTYPPTPDATIRSTEDPQLFTGGLWIMFSTAWKVQVIVEGARGPAKISVPLPAVSQKVTGMNAQTGAPLLVLTLLLGAGIAGIAGAAVRESRLEPGERPTPSGIRAGRVAMLAGLALTASILWLGRDWWTAEANSYAESIYRPLDMKPSLAGRHLTLSLAHTGWAQPRSLDDFIPDHGFPMHLYLVREPKMEAIYHVHPRLSRAATFEADLLPMKAGVYRLFADVVHRSGFPETLVASLVLPVDLSGPAAASVDDAGAELPDTLLDKNESVTPSGLKVVFERPTSFQPNIPVTLRFRVLDWAGNPASNLKPYLGMPAHLAVIQSNFHVFSHIHPNGTISMAAYAIAENKSDVFNPNVIPSTHVEAGGLAAAPAEFTFPFGFPNPGAYRLFLQFRKLDQVESVAFDVAVSK